MKGTVLAVVLVVAACGSSSPPTAQSSPQATITPNSSPSATASSQPSASGPLLFAALEATGTTNPNQWNTVAIAGLDGYSRAKTTFTPVSIPFGGCTGNATGVAPVFHLASAHTAAGKVYFADGTGTVRSLSPQGQVARVATFPVTSSQQMLSFAVSPDGSQLLAAIFTWPPKLASANPCGTVYPWFAPGNYSLDVYAARAGGASRLLYNQTWPQSDGPSSVLLLVGWDQVGPLGAFPSFLTAGVLAQFPGTPVRVDPNTGKAVTQVSAGAPGPPQCFHVEDIDLHGDYACDSNGLGDVSVRRQDGVEIWHFTAQAPPGYVYAFLAPDEEHVVAMNCAVYGFGCRAASSVGAAGSEVLGRDGSRVVLPEGFYHDGWLDSQTVIGGGFDRNFAYVTLSSPTNVVDIGFKGLFVGPVQGGR